VVNDLAALVRSAGLTASSQRSTVLRWSFSRAVQAIAVWAVCSLPACLLVEPAEVVSDDVGGTADSGDTSFEDELSAPVCMLGYHAENGICVDDARRCQPSDPLALTGVQVWSSIGQAYGDCLPRSCAEAYHLENGGCVSDTRSCTIGNGIGSQTYVSGRWGTCGVVFCNSGYHIESGACLSDTRRCFIANGIGSQTYASGSWGTCGVVNCNSGYHIESGRCASNTRICSVSNATTATQTWNSATSAYGACTASACASGYLVAGGACVIGTLGAACTLNTECASGNCATGPTGTANDRCAPTGMNYIPAGTFSMGSLSGEVGQGTDETQHGVTISRSFFLEQTEVTQGQWKALSGGINPSYFQSTTGTAQSTANANDSGPVEYLDWYAAVAFANARSAAEDLASCYTLTGCTDAANGWKDGGHGGCTGTTFTNIRCTGYRLPTEREWEYAARGGSTTATYLGNLSWTTDDCSTAQAHLDGIAWWCINSSSRTQAVGGKAANSFGLYDMLGNVWEWTGDWYAEDAGAVTDPTGPATGSDRVFRGGSWRSYARDARAASRNYIPPAYRISYLGFRLARTAP
jgi:formylglycine-generating enzyme required for sulfatase activity